ncbi:MAG: Glucose 1-dehydrogenase B [Candidatus Thorarchaeota archaeon AB_25]|nr:MAG: Glucose 1-dehydrogenase B [Candidatus Thorarchaeota archaeon AB_25]
MVKYNLEGKVVIITGASAGLGEQFAHAFADSGAHVVLGARREDLLKKIANDVSNKYGVKALPIKTDVAVESDVINLVDTTVKELGTVDVLVNNAGTYVVKPLIEQTLEDWNLVMNVNLTSSFVSSREVAKVMIPKKSGSIINITSTFGFGATEFTEVSYYATKGGLVTMTKALAVELGKYNIRVNAIAPGFFPTAMSIGAMEDKKLSDKYIRPRTALPMFAENEWIRGAACFLASDDARYITGHTLAVDGGWLAY